ncbi:Oaf3p [Pleurotus pulmonarius]|nr:Oaf3p [Pleurotus pulmonarius]
MSPDSTNNEPSLSGKQKRTRNRLRLSCLECTRRRQASLKCDRNQPCGLCVSRDVSHLCRWENVPVARPVPQRPPNVGVRAESQTAVACEPGKSGEPSAAEMLARIAALEQTIAEMKMNSRPPRPIEVEHETSESLGNNESHRLLNTNGETSALIPVKRDAYIMSAALALVSIGHHGEFIGRGSAFCALHMLGSPDGSSFPYAKSTDAVGPYRQSVNELMPPVLFNTVEHLVSSIPPRAVTDTLIKTFFARTNWRYGISEDWFYSAYEQMWTALNFPYGAGLQVNPNWLSLLFAILAICPQSAISAAADTQAEAFFTYGMMARRVAEDTYLSVPAFAPLESAADGTTLGCLAAPILAYFLAERKRISEAWKLIGNSIRSAQAVGMHRDPSWRQWHTMSENERMLRTRAWWGLRQWDILYSFTLSRPPMIQPSSFDVQLPVVDTKMALTDQLFITYQLELVKLSAILEKAVEKCLSVAYPTGEDVAQFDEEIKVWRANWATYLHDSPFFTVDPSAETAEYNRILRNHRFSVRTWYLTSRIKLHRSFLTQVGLPRTPEAISLNEWRSRSRDVCTEAAIEMIYHQMAAYHRVLLARSGQISVDEVPVKDSWCFEGVFNLYDAAVTVVVAMTLTEPEKRPQGAEDAFDKAVAMMRSIAAALTGKRADIMALALESLRVLGREQGWRRGDMLPAASIDVNNAIVY